MIDVTLDHSALSLGELYELVQCNRSKATVHYTLPAALIESGMSTEDGQNITKVVTKDLYVLFDTVASGDEDTDGRIVPAGERVALATFPDTEHRGGHEFVAAKITGVRLAVRGRPEPEPAMTATVTFIETLEDGQEIRHEAEYTPKDFPGDGTVFDTCEDFERYLYDHDADLWDLVAEDDREGWDGADADGIDLSLYPFDQNIQVQVREHRKRPAAPNPAKCGDHVSLDGLGCLTAADFPQIVRALAKIADNTDPDQWKHLLSREQEQLMTRVSAARRRMDADRPPALPELTGNTLESLLVTVGLTRYGLFTVRPAHIALIVEAAIETGLLPAGLVWQHTPNSYRYRFNAADGTPIAGNLSDLIPRDSERLPAVDAARHILATLHNRVLTAGPS